MLSKIRRGVCIVHLSGIAVLANAGEVIETAESSLGDRLEISVSPDARTTPHTVEACLLDASGGDAKGFDIRDGQTPRYVTHDHQPVCAELFAGVQKMVFWRTSFGQFQPIVSLPIDLSGRAHERLWITWRIDGAIAGASARDPQE